MAPMTDDSQLVENIDCTTSIFRTARSTCGYMYAAFCLPFSACGMGPFLTILQGHVGVVTVFGKFDRLIPPGTYSYNIGSEAIIPVCLKTVTLDVPEQNVMTKDNLTVRINAVVYFRVFDAKKALYSVANYRYATNNLAQCTLRTIIGENTLADLFNARKMINARLTELIDRDTDDWGIKVLSVEIKDVMIPDQMQRAMAAVAEASRDAEARVINAKGNLAASEILAEAADQMSLNPMSMHLQWFDTLQAIAQERNHTIIVPDTMTNMFGHLARSPAFMSATSSVMPSAPLVNRA
eukprot:TRINITY_DN127_c0_g1::TRINITY_DN127_c0_g1_i1::g.14409::m.14409 TRINITY_DN127_c0_g1::TRINITY_DN127_c0_g1_i1::g.14409  ORF type:complete len:295 (+),score=81.71,sp/O28852/Y1420_ARCFU/42.53/4e-52,Band_7/PF01145.20/2.3e-32,Band_7_1/PF13421.1/0.0051 TRINITY_DN127_c0_g1_i1:71-955(+)